tara:strand:- start:421 stop:732 length:312 start_codon:yes stop_codon:yes gene_type:complete
MFETAWDAVNGSRGEVKKLQSDLQEIEDRYGEPQGSNQAAREKWLRNKQQLDQEWQLVAVDIESHHRTIAENEGRKEALKYSIRMGEREMDYIIAHTKGVNND